MLVRQQMLNSLEVQRIVAIHLSEHHCRSSRILHEEPRIAKRPRRDTRQFQTVVPMAQFILECFQRYEGRRCSYGTYVAHQFYSVAQSLGLNPKRV